MAAGLNNTNADALADAICSALGIDDDESKAVTKTMWRTIYARLKVDIQITILAGSIATTGGPASQSGPAAPVPLTPD